MVTVTPIFVLGLFLCHFEDLQFADPICFVICRLKTYASLQIHTLSPYKSIQCLHLKLYSYIKTHLQRWLSGLLWDRAVQYFVIYFRFAGLRCPPIETTEVLSNYTYRKKSSRVWKLVEEIGNGKRKFSRTILVSERERKDCMHVEVHVRYRFKSDRQVGRD